MTKVTLYETIWLASSAVACGSALIGCEALTLAATTPGPDGVAPLDTIGEGIGEVLITPANPVAWSKIVIGVSAIVIALLGGQKINKARKARKAKKALSAV